MATPNKRPSVKGKKRASARSTRHAAVAEAPAGQPAVEGASAAQDDASEHIEVRANTAPESEISSETPGKTNESEREAQSRAAAASEEEQPAAPAPRPHVEESKRPKKEGLFVASRLRAAVARRDDAAVSEESSASDASDPAALAPAKPSESLPLKSGAPSERRSALPSLEEGPADFFDLGDADEKPSKGRGAKKERGGFGLFGGKGDRPRKSAAARPERADRQGSVATAEAPVQIDAMDKSLRKVHRTAEAKARKAAQASAPRQAATPDRSAAQSTSRKANAREKAIVRSRRRKVVMISVAVILAFAVAVSGALFWNAYLRYDDAADFQGEWQVSDGSMTVVIDATNINMPDSLSYAYTLDTWEKTISFTFDDLTGGGTYQFSSDRTTLVIQEGEGDNATTLGLVKVSDDTSAEPHVGEATAEAPAEADAATGEEADASGESAQQPADDAVQTATTEASDGTSGE